MRIHLLSFTLTAISAIAVTQRSASAQVSTYHACGTGPASNEVYIYSGSAYSGTCAALYVGFYPFPGTGTGEFGIGNDDISSIKVGSGVNARGFVNYEFSPGYNDFTGGTTDSTMPAGWDNQISSIRVTSSARSLTCNDLVLGEFALFGDVSFGADCVVLKYGSNYNTSDDMGIANDSVSSVNGGPGNGCPPDFGPGYSLTLYNNFNQGGSFFTVYSGTSVSDLTPDSFNDVASSIGTAEICLD